jgi:SPP1 gp7 family putative phage head morphogenesis protein
MPKLPKPARQPTGKSLEREYWRKIRTLIDPARKLVDELLIPELARIGRMAGIGTRQDASRIDVEPWANVVAAIMAEIRERFDDQASAQVESLVSNMGSQADSFNLRAVRQQIAGVLGVDVWTEVPEIGPMLQAWAVENVGLIKSVPERYFSEIEGIVLRSFNAGQRAEEIAPQIAKRYGVSESRGMLIARDQISKLQGDLTRQRQTSLGVKKYVWRTSQDERVRSSHRKLNGKTFSWNKPPITNSNGDRNHPGGDYQCRCTADPVIDLDEIAGD